MTERLPMSVPEINFSPDFDLLHPEKASRLAVFRMSKYPRYDEFLLSAELQRPLPFLLQFVQSVILGGEIVQKTAPPSGENATYLLDFMGPQLSCHEEKPFNRTVPKMVDALDMNTSQAKLVVLDLGNSSYTSNLGKLYYTCNTGGPLCETVQSMESGLVWPITQSKVLASSLCTSVKSKVQNQTEFLYNYLLETTETKCTERYVSYTANVSYVKGTQSITYTTHDLDPQPLIPNGYDITWNQSIPDSEVNSVLSDERSEIQTRLRYNNALTVYTALWQLISSVTHTICDVSPPPTCDIDEDWQSPNGTRMGIGTVYCRQEESRKYSISPPCQPPKYAL
jgi:hypothetical protein